jgi:hypothetical protein
MGAGLYGNLSSGGLADLYLIPTSDGDALLVHDVVGYSAVMRGDGAFGSRVLFAVRPKSAPCCEAEIALYDSATASIRDLGRVDLGERVGFFMENCRSGSHWQSACDPQPQHRDY